ncbi:30S ribosomal protein S1 [Geothermobacter hydrogeniphilus]|uniref:30S ribosomal protein S1 n=1 Tax=Geothermobacter hydrogeniphilus TaxID=1969733 RepID=A0A1X0XZD1_9BACT|nr:30S ribosomal protein S1 [Geothermobacter hydrogeniphilus]ORJ58291.1 30S ribosomal protein S1 [Geothermobacter hydrogeniphilus]
MNSDDKDFDPNEEEDFAALLEQSLSTTGLRIEPGQKVEAKVLQIGSEWIFLDVGQKGEGVLDVRELQDADGRLTVTVGDTLAVYFISSAGGELRFTTRLGGGASGTEQLEQAWQGGIPVEGRIEKEIKGGYEIRLPGGVRSFCPFSQLGLRREENPETLLGQTLSFKISQFSEQGRNIVVSHREILEEERRQQREELRTTLKDGQVVQGTVTNIRDFGAFVDIGGIEGLLPISEISYGRVEDINEVLHVGQQLEVAVKSCDWENNRFSFSLRDTLADPWDRVGTVFAVGTTHTGTVSRLANFGAFVTLDEGLDGLLHISKLGGGRRIRHPKEELMVGQQLRVTIEQVDREARRISLAPATEGETGEQNSYLEQPSSGGMGTFADLFKAGMKKK